MVLKRSMQKKIDIKNLIIAITNYVKDKNGYLTKTKLDKYLYLLDIEYYRLYRETLTGFKWIYYKFGPWTNEFEYYYSEMVKQGMIEVAITGDAQEVYLLSTEKRLSLDTVLRDAKFRVKAKIILSKYAKEKLSAILDFVYFYTDPMDGAVRMETLDFTKISPESPDDFVIIKKSAISKKKLALIKSNLQSRLDAIPNRVPASQLFNSKTYDSDYWEFLDSLDCGG